jgi:hypothetical protein
MVIAAITTAPLASTSATHETRRTEPFTSTSHAGANAMTRQWRPRAGRQRSVFRLGGFLGVEVLLIPAKPSAVGCFPVPRGPLHISGGSASATFTSISDPRYRCNIRVRR